MLTKNKQSKAPETLKTRFSLESEVALDTFVPYSTHYDRHTVKTLDDRLIRVFEVKGVTFETASDDEINKWHSQLHQMYMTNADEDVSFWTHIIKEEDDPVALAPLTSTFAKQLDRNYKAKLFREKHYRFSLFITVVVKPKKQKLLDREGSLLDTKDKLDNVSSYLEKLEHSPRPLGLYEKGEQLFSEALSFLSRLVSGTWQEIPVTHASANTLVCNSRILAGRETLEIRTPTDNMYCAALGLKEYMGTTNPILLRRILSLPFPFILAQSFSPVRQQQAVGLLKKNKRMMEASQDPAISQIAELDVALDDVASRRICMGEHTLSLFVYTDPEVGHLPTEEETRLIKHQIKDRVSYCLRELGDTGAVAVREDLGLVAQYFAMLPANHKYRARISYISSANFCGLFPMHSVPSGRWDKKHWGDTVIPLQTRMGTLYDFSFHPGSSDLGNTLIIGSSGAGKTALIATAVSQMEKFNAKGLYFDKDRGAEIFIRAINGHYAILHRGQPTGFNPYQLPPSKENLDFLTRLTLKLIYPNNDHSPKVQNEVGQVISRALSDPDKPKHLKTLSEIYKHFQSEDIRERLLRWTGDNQHGWLFDNIEDTFSFDAGVVGVDTTEFLDDREISSPVFLYLTHRAKELYGNRFWIVFDEFWKQVGDPVFQPWIKDESKVIRKKGGLIIAGTQDVGDILKSDIADALLNQYPTRLFLSNNEADKAQLRRFNITDIEFEYIKYNNPKHREFIVKQGQDSVVVALDLSGLDDELAVLSGRESNLTIMEQCIAESSDNPDDWLPLYYQRYKTE